MYLKRLLLFVLIIVFLSSTALAKVPDCSCQKMRQISLQTPRLKGNDIWELQRELKELGYYNQELNAIYDWDTYLAVKKFQYANDLPGTGIVTQKTWFNLAEVLDKKPSIVTSSNEITPPPGEVFILIDGYKRQLKVFSDGELHYTFPVAIGKPETKSPVGEWAIVHKDAGWGGGFGDRWMGLNVPWGKYGIHGTNKPGSIGTAASHGCIRMYNRHVKVLYKWVEVGTRVKIIGRRDSIDITHHLRPGQVGRDVLLLQESLRAAGFKPGYTDGMYGAATKQAMKELKYIYGLRDDLIADDNVFNILNLK
ncbi:L,D-transpeptidase family protein [Halanaerobaculum tunisiense]